MQIKDMVLRFSVAFPISLVGIIFLLDNITNNFLIAFIISMVLAYYFAVRNER